MISFFLISSSLVKLIWPSSIPNEQYDVEFSFKNVGTEKKEIFGFKQAFDRELIACFLISLAIGVWYFMKKVSLFYFLLN
jgi:hypothetical protein